jgi:hypothetical protein
VDDITRRGAIALAAAAGAAAVIGGTIAADEKPKGDGKLPAKAEPAKGQAGGPRVELAQQELALMRVRLQNPPRARIDPEFRDLLVGQLEAIEGLLQGKPVARLVDRGI